MMKCKTEVRKNVWNMKKTKTLKRIRGHLEMYYVVVS